MQKRRRRRQTPAAWREFAVVLSGSARAHKLELRSFRSSSLLTSMRDVDATLLRQKYAPHDKEVDVFYNISRKIAPLAHVDSDNVQRMAEFRVQVNNPYVDERLCGGERHKKYQLSIEMQITLLTYSHAAVRISQRYRRCVKACLCR